MRLVLWLGVACLGYGLAEECALPRPGPKEDVSFDYLMLVLQWPPGVALQRGMDPVRANAHQQAFTLHGLWPSREYDNATYPQACSMVDFEPISDAKLLASMQEHWPSFQLGGSNDVFWAHEWEKHGTCIEGMNQTGYFTKTLDKRQEFVAKYQAGFLAKFPPSPTAEYVLADVISYLGGGVVVSCNRNGSEVLELTVCLDKEGSEVKKCPSTVCNLGCGERVKLLGKPSASDGGWGLFFFVVALLVGLWVVKEVIERRRRRLLTDDSALLPVNSTELSPVAHNRSQERQDDHWLGQHEEDDDDSAEQGLQGKH